MVGAVPRVLRVIVCLLATSALAGPAAASDLTALADQVFELMNQERTVRGLSPLVRIEPLDTCAQNYAVRMAIEDFLAHVAPDGSTAVQRMAAVGYPPGWWGENLAAGQPNSQAVMRAWMNSAGHAENILSEYYTHVGVGVEAGGSYGIYWVLSFGGTKQEVPASRAPRLERVTTAGGGHEAVVILEGVDFASPGAVTMDGIPAKVETWSPNRIVVRAPKDAGPGPVVVTNLYGSTTVPVVDIAAVPPR